MRFALIAAALITAPMLAAPAFAQATDIVDASGATAGRHPHKPMRQVSTAPSCKTIHLPAGKLPTYGNPALDPRCQPVTLARADDRTAPKKD